MLHKVDQSAKLIFYNIFCWFKFNTHGLNISDVHSDVSDIPKETYKLLEDCELLIMVLTL